MRYKTIQLTVIIILSFLIQCKNQHQGNQPKKNESTSKNNLLNQQKESIKGKQIKVLSKILKDSIKTSNKTIFLYNGFDCGTCIDIGYELAKKIDSLKQLKIVYIISTSTNIGRDQIKYNYTDFVYNDEKDLIRKELKFIYTPVLLSLDAESKISSVFFPSSNRDFKAEENFIIESVSK